jgi:hypothetical protein
MRRLFYESHALVIVNMRSQIDRPSDETPRRMMPAERHSRHEQQQKRLGSALIMTGEYECSHALVDMVNQQVELNALKHIPLERCTKRSQELNGIKINESFRLNNQGFLVKHNTDQVLLSDNGNDLKVRYALVRRGLAFDQCNLLDYAVHDLWVTKIFEVLYKPPPQGFVQPGLERILAADRAVCVHGRGHSCWDPPRPDRSAPP